MAGVVLDGHPYNQGLFHGRAFHDKIRHNIDVQHRQIDMLRSNGVDEDIRSLSYQSFDYAVSVRPYLADEIEGIAAGSGQDIDDIVMHNFPVALLLGLMPMECSQVLLPPDMTTDGRTLLAKTRDNSTTTSQENVILHRILDDGREVIEMNLAGSVTLPGTGLNDSGLMFSTSGVWSRTTVLDWSRIAQSWLVVHLSGALRDCNTVDELEQFINDAPRIANLNILTADAGGAYAALETTPHRVVREDRTTSLVCRTNHYRSDELRADAPTAEEYPSTHNRFALVDDATRERSKWSEDDLWQLMASHHTQRDSGICRHGRDGIRRASGADGESVTDSLTVVSWPDGVVDGWLGAPCARVLKGQQ